MSKELYYSIPTDAPWTRATLIRFAVQPRTITVASARDALRAAGVPLRHAADFAAEARRVSRVYWDAKHRESDRRRVERFDTYSRQWLGSETLVDGNTRSRRRHAARLFESTAQGRLRQARELAVRAAVSSTLWTGTRHTIDVVLGGEPGVAPTATEDRSVYHGRFKGRAANRYTYTVTVPHDWRVTVQRRGLATIGGMLTLSATEVRPGVYSARWAASSGPGRPPRVVDGWICGQYHSTISAEDAETRGRRSAVNPSSVDLDSVVARFGAVRLNRRHAYAAGLRQTGTESWLTTVGLDGQRTATVADIVAAYRARPRGDVLRVLARVR